MEASIKFKSLSDQLYDYLSTSIIEGRLKPGEKLIENDLYTRFGISRSPIRECFRILESEGLIVINPRKGTFVRELTPKDIEDVFPVRASLESLAARLAVPNIGVKELEMFDKLIMQMEASLKNNDIRSFLNLNFMFHSIFIKASNNQVLENTLRNLGKGLWLRIAFLYYQSSSGLDYSNKMHKEIVKGFRQKDSSFVQKLMEEHIEHAKQQLLKHFASSQKRHFDIL
jgi:DNA-binding GntR family transcriptional regulator